MTKNILLIALSLFLFATGSLQAQKGFDKKKKTSNSAIKPSFAFEEVKIPRATSSSRIAAKTSFTKGIRANFTNSDIIRNEKGRVIWLESKRGLKTGSFAAGRTDASAVAFQFLDGVKNELGLKVPSENFEVTSVNTDERNQTHIRMRQSYKQIPVYGGEIILHTVHDTLRLMNGYYFPEPSVDITPKITKETAESNAIRNVAAEAIVRQPKAESAKRFLQADHELVIYHQEENPERPHLSWHVTIHPNFIERWEYFVDAHTGVILNKYNHTCGADGTVTAKGKDLNNIERTFGAYQIGSNYYMIDATKPMFNNNTSKMPDEPVGGIWTIDASNTYGDNLEVKHVVSSNLNNWNATAVSAHQNGSMAYEYFRKTFQRNSLNGKGGTIISIINIADEEDGKGMDNAFWNGEFMGYGNGRSAFKPLAGGLDVAGHEMTHGVIQNTANLEYQGQSGAINESLADVFGVLIDRNNWTLGEDVVKTAAFPSGALRSMSNPNQNGSNQNGYQPKTMTQYVTTSKDNGGVHINSGIPNFAFYNIASVIGREKSELIYYRAMTQYLTRKSQFLDLRLAIVQSATDLYGAGSTEVNTANSAFDAVGITSGTTAPAPDPTDLPVNNGADGILVLGTDDDVLYQTTPQAKDFTPRSSKGTRHKPSVTDNGEIAYFVSTDKRIVAITLKGTAQEQIVSDEAIWDNVAISRDGKKLAALTSEKENSIYVYSFDKKQWKKFTLYNPTYSDGVTTGDVKYSDALVWDLTGEFIVYDAFNELNSVDGQNHEYWDVGFLRAWDNTAGDFGDGNIEKLFTNLEDGENIGNPAFSKNSPNLISFDYLYEPEDTYEIIGVDTDKGTVNTIYTNNTLGFPDYSKKDDQMIFNTESNGAENVGIINLAADHISASGNASILIEGGKLGVWYGQGTRQTSKQNQTITFVQLSDRIIGDKVFELTATASSNLAVTFERVSGGVTLQGKQVTITKAGKATLRALQIGNDQYNAASSVDRTFCVNPSKPVVVQNGQNYTATSQGASEYVWYEDGIEVYRDANGAVTIEDAGIYEVRANTADGCLSAAMDVHVDMVLGTEPVSFNSSPYPNPVKDNVFLEGIWKTRPESVGFTNVSGQFLNVTNFRIQGNKLVIPAGNLHSGIYILNIKSGVKNLTYKILKE